MRAARQHGPAGTVATQGHVLAPGDFVHTLAVEGVVHHLDLTLEVPSPGLPDAAYELVVEVLTGLLGTDLPTAWSRRRPSSRAPAASRSATRTASRWVRRWRPSPSSADGVPSRDGHREGRRGPGRLRAHEPASHARQGDRPARGGGGAGRPDRRVPRGVHPRDPDLDRLPADLGRRRAVVRDAGRPGSGRPRAGHRRPRRRRPSRRDLRGDGRRGAGAPRVDDLQHDAVHRTGRGAPRQAPQADAHRLRADGVGDGRRLDAAGGRHAVRPAQRADLLGELHAAGPVLPVLPGRRHLGRADPGPRRRWVATMRHIAREGRCYVIGVNPCLHVDQIPADFPHRERRSGTVESDDEQWVEAGNTVIVDSERARSSPDRRGTRRRSSRPTSTWTRCAPRGACSTRSGTTTGRTCSTSRPTFARVPPSWSRQRPTQSDAERD